MVLSQIQKTWLAGLVLGLWGLLMMKVIFQPVLRELNQEIEKSRGLLSREQELLGRKKSLEARWETQKVFFNQAGSAEDLTNAWIKGLLNYAQSQSFVMDKLEPGGIKETKHGKQAVVFMSFQGDIRKLNSFLYYLTEKDPLSQVESLAIRQDESGKSFSYELMLSKVLS